jgi:hypothetical protein
MRELDELLTNSFFLLNDITVVQSYLRFNYMELSLGISSVQAKSLEGLIKS